MTATNSRSHSPVGSQPAASQLRFPDGAHFRIEIPSVEGPRVLAAVIKEAQTRHVTVNRVSQGSGGMLLTRSELEEMAEMAQGAGMEVCLFVGPRAVWDIGVLPHVNAGFDAMIRGSRQIKDAVKDVLRAVNCGIRAFLVGDIGLLRVLDGLRSAGDIPPNVVFKISAYQGVFNAHTAAIMVELGGDTINIPADISLADLAEFRDAVDRPLDLYVEAPDAMGGTIRISELPQIVSAGAPMYLKFGLSNAPSMYPSGLHLEASAVLMAREKVHRAAVAMEWIQDDDIQLMQSQPGARGLAVPET